MALEILSVALLAFLTTLFLLPRFKAYLENSGVVGTDVQKADKPWMASSGGLPVVFGFLAGVLAFVFFDGFLLFFKTDLAKIFAGTLSVVLAMLVGLLDDIHSRRRGSRRLGVHVGLRQWQKPLLTLAAAVPLMVSKAGVTLISVPFFGNVDFGVLYPLFLVPVAVVCVTNAANMLAGMNGLEAGMGSVALLGAGTYALISGNLEGAAIGLSAGAALLAFLVFNFYPARILPGDSLTYLIGAAFIATIIVGNIEKFGAIVFMPWIAEAFLKLRSGFRAESVGVLQPNGTLRSKHDKIYSLTHVGMRLGLTEKQITTSLILLELALVLLAFRFVTTV
ncbi:MAG: hypothetical protein HYS81_02310 [Candidatus Aenigmatarchaeota archaeon]|nr:MAG: hypothetical protein HYS81_02310 [Candidatus Aenigmarchaeota archaeon]